MTRKPLPPDQRSVPGASEPGRSSPRAERSQLQASVVITITGSLGAAASTALRRRVRSLLDAGVEHVLLDLSGVRCVDLEGAVGLRSVLLDAAGAGDGGAVLLDISAAVESAFALGSDAARSRSRSRSRGRGRRMWPASAPPSPPSPPLAG